MVAEAGAPPVVCLMGPTGTGKSGWGLELAREFDVEIVSVDSALVYRGMDVGTAKPGADVLASVPHHLIDCCDPRERYSAGRFREDALACIAAIHRRGRVPLLVGGTLLYFHVLWRGLAPLPEGDPAVRVEIDQEAGRLGWNALHRELASVDPDAASRIRPTDRQRIQRALEVFRLTGRPISRFAGQTSALPGHRYIRIALVPSDRARLYRGLDERLDAMMGGGFLAEVRRLTEQPGLGPDLPSMRAVGYRQLARHLRGELTLDDAVREAKVATHRLAKRQLTWLRGRAADHTIDPFGAGAFDDVRALIAACGVARRV